MNPESQPHSFASPSGDPLALDRLWEQWEALAIKTGEMIIRHTKAAAESLRIQAWLCGQLPAAERQALAERKAELFFDIMLFPGEREAVQQETRQLWEQMTATLCPLLKGPRAAHYVALVQQLKGSIPEDLLTRLREACPGAAV